MLWMVVTHPELGSAVISAPSLRGHLNAGWLRDDTPPEEDPEVLRQRLAVDDDASPADPTPETEPEPDVDDTPEES